MRIASYAQQSQRYVEIDTNKDWYIIPPEIEHNSYAKGKYIETLNKISFVYKELLSLGVPKEDARMVLPNACKTKLVLTTNLRSIIEQYHERGCSKAQWEIKRLYEYFKYFTIQVYPFSKSLFVPKCVIHNKCYEKVSCGKYNF